MLEQERRDPGDVGIADAPTLLGELADGGLDVGRVPQRDGVQRQAESAELLLLFVPMGFPDYAAVAVANAPGKSVAELLAVELGEDAAALFLAVDVEPRGSPGVAEHVQRLDDPSQLGERVGERSGTVLDLQHAHDGAGMDATELQRSRQAQHVLPVAGDEIGVDAVAREPVQRAVVGGSVDAPEPGVADVGEPGAELVAEQPEQSDYRVGISCCVGHDLGGFEIGFLAEQQSQNDQAVAPSGGFADGSPRGDGAGHDDDTQPGELVGNEVVVGDAAAGAEVFWVGSGVDGVAWGAGADAVGRGHLAVAPDVGDWQGVLRRYASRARRDGRWRRRWSPAG